MQDGGALAGSLPDNAFRALLVASGLPPLAFTDLRAKLDGEALPEMLAKKMAEPAWAVV